ncbi:MAG: lipid IV(A) 3-deoxy-D-manno-octulosonic acid transferase [Bermanella sp.]
MARFIYSLIFTLLLPFILIRLAMRARKTPAYGERWLERFGIFTKPNFAQGKQAVWFHTVSVGEFIAAVPLIEQVMAADLDRPIVITTTTPTGSEQVKKRFESELGKRVFHVYLPYDLPWFLSAFQRRLRPQLLVILETELWPNLIHSCHKHGTRVLVANARLSEKSAKGYAKLTKLSAQMLGQIDCLAVQNETDGKRFVEVGMPVDNMTVTGSIKFDIAIKDELLLSGKNWREQWGPKRKVIMVASTHQGEDEIALQAFRELLAEPAIGAMSPLLIVVPRHPERFDSVANLIEAQSLKLVRRSALLSSTNNMDLEKSQVLLVDSMGELMQFLAASDVCVMGGSFVENGGHNPLEPAALQVPILMGPSQFNFALICQQLEAAGGLLTVQKQALGPTLKTWVLDDALLQRKGLQAKQVVQSNTGAKQKVFELIQRQLS